MIAKILQPLGHRAGTQIRPTANDDAGRLATGMRIDNANGLIELDVQPSLPGDSSILALFHRCSEDNTAICRRH